MTWVCCMEPGCPFEGRWVNAWTAFGVWLEHYRKQHGGLTDGG